MKNKKVKGFLAIFSVLLGTLAGCKNSDFDPSQNQNVEIYGPPEMMEQNMGGDISDNDADEELEVEYNSVDEYEPEDNIPICIYGPPEMFEEENNSENK